MQTTYNCEIEQIVQSIFSSMLNIELVRLDDELPASDSPPRILATVHISGQWMGSVVLAFSIDTARAAANAMLGIPEADVNDADLQDVAAELANMVGGNLKSVLPAPSTLSLPTVVTGGDFDQKMHGADLIDDLILGWDHHQLHILLYTKR